jgi:uncharacterized protein
VSPSGAYRTRIVDDELRERLAAIGAVVIEGPRACGKTSTAREAAASEVLFDLDEDARATAALDPGLLLDGPVPRLIDEWQLVPAIWNHVRRAVDDRRATGQFILTGSAVPTDDITRHTGAGRIGRLRMRPMSLVESGDSSAAVSLRGLLDGATARSPDSGHDLRRIAELICRGGWPSLIDQAVNSISATLTDYLDDVCRIDVPRVDGHRRDPIRLRRLLSALARNTATPVALTTLGSDAAGGDGAIDEKTVRSYLDVLERLMVIEHQPAWAPHLRSRARLRTTPSRHFVDPSLAVAALGASPQTILRDLSFFGLLFESMVVRDLRVFAQPLDADVFIYNDNTLEIDAIVVERWSGRWGAFEIKLGGSTPIDRAADSLNRFRERLDLSKCGEPAFLGVIVATGFGYRRKDGVQVIPIGALGP